MSLFGQVNMTDMAYAPSKGEITEWNANGKNVLPDKTIRQKEMEYINNYTEDTTVQPLDSQPAKDRKQYYPLNSFGFSLGLKYSF
jgi:hypothetical protein